MQREISATSLVPFTPDHVPAAAALVAGRVRALRRRIPSLPAPWADETVVGRVIGELAIRGSGFAALRGERLLAFQAATILDGHGGRWAYTPDVGHAVADSRVLPAAAAARVVEEVYAQLAERWAREACLEHVVTVLAHDSTTTATLGRLGFGQLVIDLVRDLSAVEGRMPVAGVSVRRAGPTDAPAVAELDAGLRRHLAGAPIFRGAGPAQPPELQRRILADPAVATFVAEDEGHVIAMLRIGPSANDVATIVRDPGTASITAAYTVADRRGDGVATLLLDAAVRWARAAGYARSAVDHESANGEAHRFWGGHFTPATVSLVRRLPAGVTP